MTITARRPLTRSRVLDLADHLTPRLRLIVAASIGVALLAPSQVHSAKAGSLTITPQFVNNLTTVTLSMSGASVAHSTLAPASKPVVKVSGPASGPSQDYSAENIRFDGSTLKADVKLASGTAATGLLGAGPGVYQVKVCQVTCTGALPIEDAGTFNVFAAPVSVTQAAPTVVALGGTTNVTLTGTFANGASAYADSPAFTVGAATTKDGSHLVVPVTTTASTPPGLYSLTVKNTDGSKDTCYRCVRVANFQLSSVSPAVAVNQADAQKITVSGVNVPAGVRFVGALQPQPAINGQDPIRTPSTEALSVTDWSAAFDLVDAAPGPYSVLLAAEDDSTVGLCTCLVTVQVQYPPTIASVTPGSVGQGAKAFTVTVHGANLPHGTVVSVPTASKVTLGDTSWVDNKTLNVPVTVDPEAPTGKVDLTITNPGQAGTYTCVGCLVVNPHPIVSSMSPDTLNQGRQHVPVTLTGQNFNPDTALSMADGVTVEGTKFVDSKHISLTLSVDPTAKGGLHAVTATNSDGSTSGAVTTLSVRRLVTATLTASRTAVNYGESLDLSGVVTYQDTGAPAANQTATVMATTTGAAQQVADVTTDADGAWHYRAIPKQNTSYQLTATAVGGAPASSSASRVLVTPRLTLTSPRANSRSAAATPLTITGVISPALRNPVTLYARDASGRLRAVRVTPDSSGKFSGRLALPAGSYRLWAVSAASNAYTSAVTTTISITRR